MAFLVLGFVILIVQRVEVWQLALIKIDKKLLSPSNRLVDFAHRLKNFDRSQHRLIIENEHLRRAYSQLINFETFNNQPRYNYEKMIKSLKLKAITARIIILQGDKLLVESRQLTSQPTSGLAVYDQWLIGRWSYLGKNTAKVDLWSRPNQPARVKITDAKDNFITDGLIVNDNSQIVVKNILRGINLQGGEIVKLLSGKYTKLPFIGVLGKKLYQDNVYQTWTVNLYWQNQIRINDNLLLISLP